MGKGWRRAVERLKQKTGQDRGFVPTSGARTQTMLQEAGAFLAQLKRVEKDIQGLQSSTEALLHTSRAVLAAPLPHVYEETAAGGGASTKLVETIGGGKFNPEVLSKVGLTLNHRLENEVLGPLQRWKEVYVTLLAQSKTVEHLRLEVDSRRRTVADLAAEVDDLRGRGGGGGDKARSALEVAVAKLENKKEKLAAALEAYTTAEADLNRQLVTLIRDAAWLRHCVAAALGIQGGALLDAAAATGVPDAARLGSRAAAGPATPQQHPAWPPSSAKHAL